MKLLRLSRSVYGVNTPLTPPGLGLDSGVLLRGWNSHDSSFVVGAEGFPGNVSNLSMTAMECLAPARARFLLWKRSAFRFGFLPGTTGKSRSQYRGGNKQENDGFQCNCTEIRRKNAGKINAVKIGGIRLGLKLMVNE